MRNILENILCFFGYVRIPKQAVQLSMQQEKFYRDILKDDGMPEGSRKFIIVQLEHQRILTKFLRQGRLITYREEAPKTK